MHEGEEPPENCPRCGSPKEVFVPYDESRGTGIHYAGGDTITDVLVVGSGAAAFAAAVTARSKESEVVMIEKAGGKTRRSADSLSI